MSSFFLFIITHFRSFCQAAILNSTLYWISWVHHSHFSVCHLISKFVFRFILRTKLRTSGYRANFHQHHSRRSHVSVRSVTVNFRNLQIYFNFYFLRSYRIVFSAKFVLLSLFGFPNMWSIWNGKCIIVLYFRWEDNWRRLESESAETPW